MCGISFYYSMKSEYRGEMDESLARTKHRGPDFTGTEYYISENNYIGLGHNRLSIIDTSDAGNQPMIRSHLTIIFNGEIFNFIALRDQLIEKGYEFTSHSDTEVILAAFEELGVASFAKLKGMFSFVLFDSRDNKLFIVRDTIGIKPIYLYQDKDSVFGCSEIKGLKAFSDVNTTVSRKDVYEFFNTGFLYEPDTGFQYIKKLEPGFFLEIDIVNNVRKNVCYGSPVAASSDDSLEMLVAGAVEHQEIADVPLGVFFSGGADSSILASLAKNSELLFAKYSHDASSNIDLEYSEKISKFLNKPLKTTSIAMDGVDIEEVMASFRFVAEHSEELISDYTFWATYLLSVAAKDSGYKVMLSGMGGDEVFAGYPRYIVLKYHYVLNLMELPIRFVKRFKLFPSSFSKKIERLLSYTLEKEWTVAYSRLLGYFSNSELDEMFEDSLNLKSSYVKKLDNVCSGYSGDKDNKIKLAQYMDMKGCLSHNLMVSDKASMLASIELRVPLLDEDIVANGRNTSSSELIDRHILKAPLKNILAKLLPKNLIERPKTGFNPPLDGIINKIGRERVVSELEILSRYLVMECIENVVDLHFQGKVNNTYKIWQLLYFSQWLRHNT